MAFQAKLPSHCIFQSHNVVMKLSKMLNQHCQIQNYMAKIFNMELNLSLLSNKALNLHPDFL